MFKYALTLLSALALTVALAAPPAVGSLYTRDVSGSLKMTCTASIVTGPEVGVKNAVAILTAAHCVDDKVVKDELTETYITTGEYLVTFDELEFYAVRLHRVGVQDRGFDLAVLVFSGRTPSIEPLTFGNWEAVATGDPIRNYANPLGIGLQQFEGYISMLSLERPVEGRNLYWRENAVAVVPGAGGSSGSLILNEAGQVIGVLVGVIQANMGSPFVIFVPQWKISVFLQHDSYGRPITY